VASVWLVSSYSFLSWTVFSIGPCPSFFRGIALSFLGRFADGIGALGDYHPIDDNLPNLSMFPHLPTFFTIAVRSATVQALSLCGLIFPLEPPACVPLRDLACVLLVTMRPQADVILIVLGQKKAPLLSHRFLLWKESILNQIAS